MVFLVPSGYYLPLSYKRILRAKVIKLNSGEKAILHTAWTGPVHLVIYVVAMVTASNVIVVYLD